jgi:hypothetical protein
VPWLAVALSRRGAGAVTGSVGTGSPGVAKKSSVNPLTNHQICLTNNNITTFPKSIFPAGIEGDAFCKVFDDSFYDDPVIMGGFGNIFLPIIGGCFCPVYYNYFSKQHKYEISITGLIWYHIFITTFPEDIPCGD